MIVYHQENNLSAISLQQQFTFRRDYENVHIVLDQHANCTVAAICGWINRSIRTHYCNFEPTSLCPYSETKKYQLYCPWIKGRRDRRIITTTYVMSVYHHWSCQLESRSGDMYSSDVLDTTLCDKVCQWPATSRWSSAGTPFPPPIKLTPMI